MGKTIYKKQIAELSYGVNKILEEIGRGGLVRHNYIKMKVIKMIGKTISHYKVLEKLGGGGMGVVYKAEDTKLKRSVALKFLPPSFSLDEDAKQRFIHEAQAASSLQHNNICNIHDIDETEEGQLFICMDYYEGETLKQKIERGPLKIDDVINITGQLAEGLSAAHGNGIIHRDIKSANIFITKQNEVKILDFGLAKVAGQTQLTQMGSTVGTVAYMSPEQARGEIVDHRTDIWSLGVVLYEIFTGQLPFKGDYEQAVIYTILNESPELITHLRSEIPISIEQVVGRALEKNPDKRYQHLEELLDDLKSISEGIVPEEIKARLRKAKLLKRKRAILSAVSAVFIIIMAVIVLSLFTRSVEAMDSIAVLPLENLSGDEEQEYLVEGIHDALITDLAKLGGFKRVISRHSVLRYKMKDKPLKEIAKTLNVDVLLTGAVVRIGDQVRVTAQLINPITEDYLWAERYERKFTDVLSLQNEIVTAIAKQLEIKITSAKIEELGNVRPVNPETYEAYLRGMYHLQKGTLEDIKKGMEYLRQAIDKDPGDPRAYAGLSLGYITVAHGPDPPSDALSFARASAERAIQLDSTLDMAYAALGFIKGYYDWEWDTAQVLIDKAIRINSHLAIAHYHDSWLDVLFGRMEEAITAHKRAQELDPLLPLHTAWLGEIYRLLGRYEEAIAECLKAIEINPDSPTAHVILANVFADQGKFEEAFVEYKKAAELAPAWKFAIGIGYVKAGRLDDARKVLSELEQLDITPWRAWWRATINATLGNKDEAFYWLNYKPRHAWIPWARVMDEFEQLRDDKRFQDFLQYVKLPPRKDSL